MNDREFISEYLEFKSECVEQKIINLEEIIKGISNEEKFRIIDNLVGEKLK